MITKREITAFAITTATVAVIIILLGTSFQGEKVTGTLEIKIFRSLNSGIVNPVLNKLMPLVTDFKRWKFFVILVWSALVLFGRTRDRWAALVLIVLVASSDQLTSHLIKPLVSRARPCDLLGNVHLWYGSEGWITTPVEVVKSYKSSFSFPSGHAANITSSMLFLGLVYRKSLIPLLVLAALVALSRIYIGVHWPLDVAAGILIGAILGWLAYIFYRILPGVTRREKARDLTRQAPGKALSE